MDELVQEAGGDLTDLFQKSLALYKLSKDAMREGKAVGIAASADVPDTEFVGF